MLAAVDAGTTSVRALALDDAGRVVHLAQRALRQSFPAPGLVEHDPDEILAHVDATLAELAVRVAADGERIDALGITNQRETAVALDRDDGRVLAPAIVWQDRRTAEACAALAASPAAAEIRERTGLPCDPYFSASKFAWLLEHAPVDGARVLGLCTVDTLVCWHLTGGADGGAWSTDPTNASRTMLYDLDDRAWSAPLCERFGVPREALATIAPSSGDFGAVRSASLPALAGVPVTGILGDQQAALLGQSCLAPGTVKATFGTGAFLLANAGADRPEHVDGLVTTVAWDLGAHGRAFALEGAAFVAGAAVQWLCEELGLLDAPEELGALAASVPDAAGASFVPALAGLGSPWWDPEARGALLGLSGGVGRGHVARAVAESLAFQGRAMLEAMRRGGLAPEDVRVDGGASSMDLLCQQLADGARCRVRRPSSVEATARGAAFAAGLATGALGLESITSAFHADSTFTPVQDAAALDAAYASWLDAVDRTRRLAAEAAAR